MTQFQNYIWKLSHHSKNFVITVQSIVCCRTVKLNFELKRSDKIFFKILLNHNSSHFIVFMHIDLYIYIVLYMHVLLLPRQGTDLVMYMLVCKLLHTTRVTSCETLTGKDNIF